jgi:hypothetical protein
LPATRRQREVRFEVSFRKGVVKMSATRFVVGLFWGLASSVLVIVAVMVFSTQVVDQAASWESAGANLSHVGSMLLSCAMAFRRCWYIMAPLIVVGCVGAAMLAQYKSTLHSAECTEHQPMTLNRGRLE